VSGNQLKTRNLLRLLVHKRVPKGTKTVKIVRCNLNLMIVLISVFIIDDDHKSNLRFRIQNLGWPHLELGTPLIPKWQRTLAFISWHMAKKQIFIAKNEWKSMHFIADPCATQPVGEFKFWLRTELYCWIIVQATINQCSRVLNTA